MTPAAGPLPDQRFDAVVLRSGETVEFPRESHGVLVDSSVVVRTGMYDRVVRRFSAADVDHVIIRSFSPGRTLVAVAIVAAAVLAMLHEAAMSSLGSSTPSCGTCW